MSENIRMPAVAGLFYPENAEELSQQIASLLEENKPAKKYSKVAGIIAPHAGYIYSGKSGAIAYNVLKENSDFKTAIIISPSHLEYFKGSTIFDGDAYRTPLGDIPINKELSKFIVEKSKTITFGSKGHGGEHALEVQLPFLQMIKSDFDIVPIVIGDQSLTYIQDLSNVLSELMDENTIIIASSDLSHFHTREKATELDNIVVNRINNFEYPELYSDLNKSNCYACGGGGIIALMQTADILGLKHAEVLSYTDSGDVTNDNSSVVGYLSAVIFDE